jgi:hypothetical protein
MAKMKFLLSEKIDRAKAGRTQTWIVEQMKAKGIKINDVQFSRKKKGIILFTEDELMFLSALLKTDFSK